LIPIRIWRGTPTIAGIDFNDGSHQAILMESFPQFVADDFPDVLPETQELDRFFTRNSQFSGLDAFTLFVLLRSSRPRRVIELGSAASSGFAERNARIS
jgi:hypothetical protein